MKKQINKSIKSARQEAAEIYEAIFMEIALVFKIDDKLNTKVNTLASLSIGFST